MRKYTFSLFVIIVLFPHTIFSQGEANNWIFQHDHYISFNSGSPELVTPPPATECPGWEQNYCDFFSSQTACSSISDRNGNLLLYTNNYVVWNNQFDTVFKSNIGGTFNHIGASQTLLLPHPGNSN
ncbi:MAG: hypothetical protein U9R19_15515, partial [Bacteroidota bacterium]|nr:hypothetical protein [Bacteroidota bacterium]